MPNILVYTSIDVSIVGTVNLSPFVIIHYVGSQIPLDMHSVSDTVDVEGKIKP